MLVKSAYKRRFRSNGTESRFKLLGLFLNLGFFA